MTGYVFGALCANGIVMYNEKKSVYFISFETSDKDLTDLFIKFWENIFSDDFNIYERYANGKKRYIFKVYDKKLTRRFVYTYKIRTGSARWRIPQAVFSDTGMSKGFISGFFDASSYIRIRIRERRGKREKIRNIRVVSLNKTGLADMRRILSIFNIHAMLYSSGKGFCLDIEGKTKLETFQNNVGYMIEINKTRLLNAISFFS